MITRLEIYSLTLREYLNILKTTEDQNRDCLWDFSLEELHDLMESTKDCELTYRALALIKSDEGDYRLYELPEDWRKCNR